MGRMWCIASNEKRGTHGAGTADGTDVRKCAFTTTARIVCVRGRAPIRAGA